MKWLWELIGELAEGEVPQDAKLIQPPWMLLLLLLALMVGYAVAAHAAEPPFSTFNCKPTGRDDKPCERVKWPQQKAWFAWYEVEAAVKQAHSGLSVRIPHPWLRLGELTAEEAPKCADLKVCAVIVVTRNPEGQVVRYDVRMREWDLRIFCAAWAEVFEQNYGTRLPSTELKHALALAIINAEQKVTRETLREEWK